MLLSFLTADGHQERAFWSGRYPPKKQSGNKNPDDLLIYQGF